FEAGDLTILAPSLLLLEIVNVAGRRWGWEGAALADLAAALDDLPFVIVEPPLSAVASWVARGLTAYDAAYLAVAEATGAPLISDDGAILSTAPDMTEPLR
ncbi:MAG TPA: type II toxin-antitoxin system VapC family toxin, partial [Actinomycetota bacterium]|nr:type II toxin-antitoxin system VapC family toxin [Actinomycetota bacterium]